MATMYFEADGDLSCLADRVVSVIGFGNQGEAQAQNLRDSGVKVVVGTKRDASFQKAKALSFEVVDVAEAVRRASIHLLLVPDEIMPAIFEEDIRPIPKSRAGGRRLQRVQPVLPAIEIPA